MTLPHPGPRAQMICEGAFGCGGEWAAGDAEKHGRGCKTTGLMVTIGFPILFVLFILSWVLAKFQEHGLIR